MWTDWVVLAAMLLSGGIFVAVLISDIVWRHREDKRRKNPSVHDHMPR